MSTFNIGDRVVLKSGGPQMTVVSVDADETETVNCKWFSYSQNSYTSAGFGASEIEHAGPTHRRVSTEVPG